MKAVNVKIQSRSQGSRSDFCLKGTLERKEGAYRVIYDQDGDRVELIFSRDSFFMHRMGETELKGIFRPGHSTALQLRFHEGSDSLPVFTFFFSVEERERELVLRLVYDLLFGDASQNFDLMISIF